MVIVAGASIAFLSMGTRQAFGVFLKPIVADLQTGREQFSLAIAILNLAMGVPIAGMIADKVGHRRVMVVGSVLFAVGLIATSRLTQASGLYLTLGLVAGAGFSALSLSTILGAVGKVVSAQRRTFAFGLITAGTSLGMAVLTPTAGQLLTAFGWRTSFNLFAGLAILMIVATVFVPGRKITKAGPAVVDEKFIDILKGAAGNNSYLLLVAGFFVCGFHVAFIATHLPSFLEDKGISTGIASLTVGLIGIFNIVGSLVFGWLGDRYRKRTLLASLYATRAVLITLLLVMPITNATALFFGASIGVVWLATAPLTSSTVAQLLGARYLSTLYGLVFFSHQVGAFLGVYLGGRLYDATGSYQTVWIIAIVLGVLAAIVHLPIDDKSPVSEAVTS